LLEPRDYKKIQKKLKGMSKEAVLMYAAMYGLLDFIVPEIDSMTEIQFLTSCKLAVRHNQKKLSGILFDRIGERFKMSDEFIDNVVWMAIINNNDELYDLMLEIDEIRDFYMDYLKTNKNASGGLLLPAVAANNIYVAKKLLSVKEIDPCVYGNACLRTVCEYGYTDMLVLLLSDKRVDPNIGIEKVCNHKQIQCLEMLLADNSIKINSTVLINAIKSNSTEIVEKLLTVPSIDLSVMDILLIKRATKNVCDEIKTMLCNHEWFKDM